VVAEYNFRVLLSLLRHAVQIELSAGGWTREATEAWWALRQANNVDGRIGPGGSTVRLTIFGRQDALGVWARHGRRVARTVVQLLERARPLVLDGLAVVSVRDRRAALRLTPEVLDILGGAPAPCIGWAEADGWDQAAVLEALAAARGRPGWSIRRLPDPQAWAGGVVVPDLLVRNDAERFLVVAVRSLAHAGRLAPIAQAATTGEPFLFVGQPSTLGPLRAVGARTIALPRFDVGAVIAALQEPEGQAAAADVSRSA
jgi:hypothetical protein